MSLESVVWSLCGSSEMMLIWVQQWAECGERGGKEARGNIHQGIVDEIGECQAWRYKAMNVSVALFEAFSIGIVNTCSFESSYLAISACLADPVSCRSFHHVHPFRFLDSSSRRVKVAFVRVEFPFVRVSICKT